MRLFRGLDKAVLQRVGRCIPRIFPSDKKKDKNYILKEEKKESNMRGSRIGNAKAISDNGIACPFPLDKI